MIIFGEGDIGTVEQLDIIKVEWLLCRWRALGEGKGVDWGSEEGVDLYGVCECGSICCEMIGGMILLISIE